MCVCVINLLKQVYTQAPTSPVQPCALGEWGGDCMDWPRKEKKPAVSTPTHKINFFFAKKQKAKKKLVSAQPTRPIHNNPIRPKGNVGTEKIKPERTLN